MKVLHQHITRWCVKMNNNRVCAKAGEIPGVKWNKERQSEP